MWLGTSAMNIGKLWGEDNLFWWEQMALCSSNRFTWFSSNKADLLCFGLQDQCIFLRKADFVMRQPMFDFELNPRAHSPS